MDSKDNGIDISVVIVNYRVKYFLEQTVRSAKEALEGFRGEIIVIDNNSGDDSISHLRECFPDVIVIQNSDNPGFGRANNQGFDIARGRFTLILNPDTVIGSHTLRDCVDFYEAHKDDCGGIGVQMHDGNGRFLPESKRSFPTPWVSFCKIFGLSKLFPRSPLFAKYHLRYLSADEAHCVDILSGAFIFVPTDLLRRIGGFDEDFFMYGEDIDLSYRLVKEGRRNYYIPSPIIHYKGESTQKDTYRYVRIFYEAMQIFFRKHYPNYSRIYGATVNFAIALRTWMSLAKRFFRRMVPQRQPAVEPYRTVVLVSTHPEELAAKIDAPHGEVVAFASVDDVVWPQGLTLTVFDNRDCTYSEIIRTICCKAGDERDFATYLSQSGVVMTPKMA